MMSFCKKSVHSFLSLGTALKDNGSVLGESPCYPHSRNIPSPVAGGLTFLFTISGGGDVPRPTNNLVESATVNSPPPSPPTIAPAAAASSSKRDPGGIGFLDEVGGSVDGLMSCTESLGFESSDERRIDDQIENLENDWFCERKVSKSKRTVEKIKEKKFPPPLSSLNPDGKPAFFFRKVRKDGRLELTEVEIDRSEILRASRQDGRLRLDLIRREDDQDVDDEEAYNEAGEEEEEDATQEDREAHDQEDDEQAEEVEERTEEKGEKRAEEWWFPAGASAGGDGFRRCHEEMVSRHRHHHHNQIHHHVWRQHCVAIR